MGRTEAEAVSDTGEYERKPVVSTSAILKLSCGARREDVLIVIFLHARYEKPNTLCMRADERFLL